METITYRGYRIKISHDNDPLNPRKDWDNLCTMDCAHRRYTLGDEQNDPEYVIELLKSGQYLYLPLYLLDHSGITISTRSFNDPWDSGKVGYIYVSKEKVRKEYSTKRITPKIKDKVYKIMEAEVETYDDYLRGNVFGYEIFSPGNEELDSCWGYFGYDHEKSGLLDEAKSMIDYYIQEKQKSHYQQLKTWIKNRVPYIYRKEFSLS